MKLGPAPGVHFFATRLLPIVLCAGSALYFGNVAYLSLSVAFIQILKVGPSFNTDRQRSMQGYIHTALHMPCTCS